jgi:hypothetical protein
MKKSLPWLMLLGVLLLIGCASKKDVNAGAKIDRVTP